MVQVDTITQFVPGDPILAVPVSIELAPDGSFILADKSDRAIKHFSPDGAQLPPVGRPGGGPGEFTSLAAAGVVDGRLFGWDLGMSRLSFFSSDDHDFDGALPLTYSGAPTWNRVRTMDDSLLVASGWVMGAQGGPLGAVFDTDGNVVARFADMSDVVGDASPQLLQNTEHFADGFGGVVFSAIHGFDLIRAYDLAGNQIGSGQVTLEGFGPMLDLPEIIEENGSLRLGDVWLQEGKYAILHLVALARDLVAIQYGKLDFETGTDLMSTGGPVVVLQLLDDGTFRKVTQSVVPGRLLGRYAQDQGLVLRWDGEELSEVTAIRVSVR